MGEGQTGGIFAPADLDELLDVRHFLRHGGRASVSRKYDGMGAVAVVLAVAVAVFLRVAVVWES